jgi:hypothetical protein
MTTRCVASRVWWTIEPRWHMVAYGGKVVSPRMLELTRENRAKDISKKRGLGESWMSWALPSICCEPSGLKDNTSPIATGPYKLGTKCLIPSLWEDLPTRIAWVARLIMQYRKHADATKKI